MFALHLKHLSMSEYEGETLAVISSQGRIYPEADDLSVCLFVFFLSALLLQLAAFLLRCH